MKRLCVILSMVLILLCFSLNVVYAQTTDAISLSSGWNFISFTQLPSDPAPIEAVLKDVSPNVRIVWGYDSANKVWLKYSPKTQNSSLNTIDKIGFGKGYWVYMDAPGTISLISWSPPASSTIGLLEGWNLIGYHGADNLDLSIALQSISGKWIIIWNWKNGQWYAKHATITPFLVSELSVLNQGYAYWIKMASAADWSLTQPGALTSIAVTPANPSIAVGDTLQLTAIGTYSDGTTKDITSLVTWSSGTTSVATVNTTGLVTGVAAGTAVITATLGTVSGSTTITVTNQPGTLVGIAISIGGDTNIGIDGDTIIAVGDTLQLTAIGTYSDGTTKDITSLVTWSSGTTSVATVNTTGLVTGVAAGTAVIKATLGTVSGSTTIIIPSSIITGKVSVNDITFEASANLATLNMDLVAGGGLLVLPKIAGLYFNVLPEELEGHDCSLHIDVDWYVLINGTVKGRFKQMADQEIIKLQAIYNVESTGPHAITLQAVNNSYWKLEEEPYTQYPAGTKTTFDVRLKAVEFVNATNGGKVVVIDIPLEADATADLATLNLDLVAGRGLLVTATISPFSLYYPPTPPDEHYSDFQTNVTWEILVDGVVKARQYGGGIIQLQAFDNVVSTGSNAITLRAINRSTCRHCTRDENYFEQCTTIPIRSNSFAVMLTGMEFPMP